MTTTGHNQTQGNRMKIFIVKNTPVASVILTLSEAMRKDLCIFFDSLCCLFMNIMSVSSLDFVPKSFHAIALQSDITLICTSVNLL